MERRGFLGLAAGALAAPGAALAAEQWDAVVDPRTGTLGEALKRATGAPFRVLIRKGTLVEKVTISAANVTIVGEPGAALVFGTYAGLPHPDGKNWGTFRTATLTVSAPGVTLRGLTIRNSFDYIGAKRDDAGNGAQAVALMVGKDADRTLVEDCRLEGYQDTLFIQSRAHISRCRIVGGVDFIFGGGAVWFDRCEIVTRYVPGATELGFVAAPSTPLVQTYGFVFHRCRLRRERGVPDRSTWLGRPWRAGGNMALTGQAVFLHSWMDGHIRREGWTSMGYTNPAGERTRLTPQEARLFEYGSTGPGAGPAAPTRRLFDAATAAGFTKARVLGDWDGRGG